MRTILFLLISIGVYAHDIQIKKLFIIPDSDVVYKATVGITPSGRAMYVESTHSEYDKAVKEEVQFYIDKSEELKGLIYIRLTIDFNTKKIIIEED